MHPVVRNTEAQTIKVVCAFQAAPLTQAEQMRPREGVGVKKSVTGVIQKGIPKRGA